jgi:hypothetical protein
MRQGEDVGGAWRKVVLCIQRAEGDGCLRGRLFDATIDAVVEKISVPCCSKLAMATWVMVRVSTYNN